MLMDHTSTTTMAYVSYVSSDMVAYVLMDYTSTTTPFLHRTLLALHSGIH